MNTNDTMYKPLTVASCSRCRKTSPIENFYSKHKNGILKTCAPCRKPRTDSNERAKAWRAKKKAEGVKVDKRGKSRTVYMREYRRKVELERLVNDKAH